jgi:tripartite-type tricarboxylate transporter receptor subunit TctC
MRCRLSDSEEIMRAGSVLVLAGLATAALSATSSGQDASDAFFKGKTITIFAGSTPGGGVDLYARLVSRYLPKHLAGNPTVIVQNQPGAGSLTAAHNLYSLAPKDGTQMAVVLPGALFDPLMKGQDLKEYDPRQLNILGNANADTTICVVRRDAPVKTYAEVFDKELVIAGSGPGSESVDAPVVEHNLLGAKLKLVVGYPGSSELKLAILQNEAQGICGFVWSSAKQLFPDLLRPDGVVKPLVQEDTKRNAELEKMGVPLVMDFAKTPDQKRVLSLFLEQQSISRPFLLPPGLPAERVSALRRAFDETMRDPDLQAEAAKQKLGTNAVAGTEVQSLVQSIYASPPDVIDELRKVSVMEH